MNDKELAAVKQALEVMKLIKTLDDTYDFLTVIQVVQLEKAITALQSIISQDALDKKAENARELGLSYDDAVKGGVGIMLGGKRIDPASIYAEPKIGCVNHDCDQCKAVQEHVTHQDWCASLTQLLLSNPPQPAPCNCKQPAPQPVPVKTCHDGKPWPVAPKPWVGLADNEIALINADYPNPQGFARAIEAKLREKNGGAA
jgi:hypothetical protein